MNRKDIALTVGGVLASMVLAYMLYRLQKRDAATAAQNAADASASNAATTTDQFSYLQGLPSFNTTPVHDDSYTTLGTSASTGFNDFLSEILSAYHSPSDSTPVEANPYADLLIQPTTPQTSIFNSGVPVDATQAQSGATANMPTPAQTVDPTLIHPSQGATQTAPVTSSTGTSDGTTPDKLPMFHVVQATPANSY